MNRDEAIDLKTSPHWKAFEGEMNRMVAMDIEKVIRETDPNVVLRLQERIKVLREVARLPDAVAEREE